MLSHNGECRLTKKVAYSLKYKLIFLISILLLAAIGLYTLFAADLFQKDKEAYVYENALTGVDQLQTTLESTQEQLKQYSEIITRLSKNKADYPTLEKFIKDTPEIMGVSIYQMGTSEDAEAILDFSSAREDFLNELIMNQKEWDELIVAEFYTKLRNPPLNPELILAPFQAQDSQLQLPAHGLMTVSIKETTQVLFLFFDLEMITKPLGQQRIFDYIIRDARNSITPLVSWHNVEKKTLQYFFTEIFSTEGAQQFQGVKSLGESDKEQYLVAFSHSDSVKMDFISLIPRSLAFSATAYLVRQSILVAIIVLSLSVIIGILFSKSLTNPLEILYQATIKMANGDFTTRVKTKGSDEIQSLGESFNMMSEKILAYMEEMKEKTRLENELAVAKLVQDSFFPPAEIHQPHLDIASFYTPASECGGDWWGHIERDEQSLIIIADATGHGVPAAFLTATIYSSVQTLDQMTPQSSKFQHGPAEILNFLNQTVCSIGKDILLTAVVLLIDKKTGQLKYANASHLDPLILRVPAGEEASKQHFIPLLDGKGPRLGHQITGKFSEESFQLQKDDKIILWTDGITEASDGEGKEWGMRKFYQSLLADQAHGITAIRDKIIGDLHNFHGPKAFEDDVTLVCCEWFPNQRNV